MAKTVRLLVAGLGNVNRSLLEIFQSHASHLSDRFGLNLLVVGASDSGGAAIDPHGLDLDTLLATKRAKHSVATLPGVGRPNMSSLEMVEQTSADVLMEATPVDMRTAQPGLDTVRAALKRGMDVVLANKGPVALAYQELAATSDLAGNGPKLRFSACVGGSLPTVNIGGRDLRGCQVEQIEAVLNGTTQIILRAMEEGGSFDNALRDAQERGLAETDPSLDVDGWDAANKLIILANAVLGYPATIDDIDVMGIRRLSSADLQAAKALGQRIVLLGLATRTPEGYDLSVRPTALPLEHPLARMTADEMGVVFHTDIAGRLSFQTLERGPKPTASAMVRDLIEITR